MTRYSLTRRDLLQSMGLSAALLSTAGAPIALGKPRRKLGVALVGLGNYSTNQLAPAL